MIKSNRGFSLLEILIVMTIMAIFAGMGARSIQTSLQNKARIDARLKVESMVFDALRIMATDLEKAFHYTNPFYHLDRNALIDSSKGSGTGGKGGAGQGDEAQAPRAPLPPAPIKLTQFIGKDDSMHFTTLNHFRTTVNSQEGDQIEVGYYLKDCRPRGSKKNTARTSCLWRRTALTMDDEVDKGGKGVVLIEYVTRFELEYLSEDTNEKEWTKNWQSGPNGTALTKNKFPYLVKISIEVEDKKTKKMSKFKQTVIANIRFPNNRNPADIFKPSASPQNPPTTPPQNPPGGSQ